MESPRKKEYSGEEISSIKERLLNKQISLEEFRNILFERDQLNLTRSASMENLKLLTDPEVVQFLQRNLEDKREYYRFLSLTEVHIAQILYQRGEEAEGFSHFNRALSYAREATMDESWVAYLEGTISYLEGREISEEVIEKVTEPRNREILIHFNGGLRKRGKPSYIEDYGR